MAATRTKLLNTSILAGVAAVTSLASVGWAGGAYAQDAQATQVEEVVVTGSRIRRDPTTAPTPLIQVTREDIERSEEANVVEYLADIPALQFSTVPEVRFALLQ